MFPNLRMHRYRVSLMASIEVQRTTPGKSAQGKHNQVGERSAPHLQSSVALYGLGLCPLVSRVEEDCKTAPLSRPANPLTIPNACINSPVTPIVLMRVSYCICLPLTAVAVSVSPSFCSLRLQYWQPRNSTEIGAYLAGTCVRNVQTATKHGGHLSAKQTIRRN